MLLIKDVCRITGLNSSTIRYYDSKGLLGEVERSDNNYRVFGKKDVEKLLFIKKARDLGFELEEIKKVLILKESGVPPCSYVSRKTQEKIALIKKEIIRLEKERKKLEDLLQEAQKVTGCRGKICHYIEGLEEEQELELENAIK